MAVATPSHIRALPDAAKAGIDGLMSAHGVRVLGEPAWYSRINRWAVQFRVELDGSSSPQMPNETDWFLVFSDSYPWGSIGVYPSVDRGLRHTFQHQRFNGSIDSDSAWRSGNICTQTSARQVLREGFDIEPYEASQRLAWHATRTYNWVSHAAEGALSTDGEPFEIPDFPTRQEAWSVAFAESPDSFSDWVSQEHNTGVVKVCRFPTGKGRLVTLSFEGPGGKTIARRDWGRLIEKHQEPEALGLWVLLKEAPVLAPWQAPSTWANLREACKSQGIDLDAHLRPLLSQFRDGRRHPMLLGFPIPSVVGGENEMVYWQAMMLPILSRGTRHAPGFRKNENGYWQRDRYTLLSNQTELEWVRSENWHSTELSSRGHLSIASSGASILMIGCGALGSAIGELLVRGGAHDITLLDGDVFQPGNLVRHTLSLKDLDRPKAEALADRLNSLSPHARVAAEAGDLPHGINDLEHLIRSSTIIIDATGSDAVLHHLSHVVDRGRTVFVSVSIGAYARRLFFAAMKGVRFDHDEFQRRIYDILLEEREFLSEVSFPREGIGCWSPVFPARGDDIWLLASVAVKELERCHDEDFETPRYVVYEKDSDADFDGVRRREL